MNHLKHIERAQSKNIRPFESSHKRPKNILPRQRKHDLSSEKKSSWPPFISFWKLKRNEEKLLWEVKFGFTTRAKNELLSDSTRKELELQLFVWDLVFEKQVLIQILIYASPLKVLWTQARPERGDPWQLKSSTKLHSTTNSLRSLLSLAKCSKVWSLFVIGKTQNKLPYFQGAHDNHT